MRPGSGIGSTEVAAFEALADGCLFVDLETEGERIRDVGALFGDRAFRIPGVTSAGDALARLAEFGKGARFVAGHNIVAHDRRFVEAHPAGAELFRLPVVDTLYLAPLAFPQRPYHRLVKDYNLDGERSDPVEDCRLSRTVMADCWRELGKLDRAKPGIVWVYRSCFDDADAPGGASERRLNGTGEWLETRGGRKLPRERVLRGFEHFAAGGACPTALRRELPRLLEEPTTRPAAAYALAWLTVAGTESVLAHWVHRSFPEAARFLHAVRGVDCGDAACAYCRKAHDPVAKLGVYFDHRGFREEPSTSDGASLQGRIVARGLAGAPLLAIMPTGGGKSLCYQLPAIMLNEQTGALTVVISPLQALMKDQVENLNRRTGSGNLAAALNGLLTLPQRHDVLEGVRLGRFALLYVSPEQLRNSSFETAVRQREIAAWVFDEAHCISKWGHDFRPDYLYAARFIREFSAREGVPTARVACFTATARLDVREEIAGHFREETGQALEVLAADRVDRPNLRYAVRETAEARKAGRIAELLAAALGAAAAPNGTAIVYARSRARTERFAAQLVEAGWRAVFFHAGVDAPEKKRIQDAFVAGHAPVIVATNAFGMGIDKEDVRLVVHADVPGSIESYLQEAGRAGRDGEPADCVLLVAKGDVERQFDLEADGRLTRRDIAQILRAIRRARRHDAGEVVLSPGEILRVPDTEVSFDEDDRSAGTRVKMAIAWLERARFVLRDENRTNVFQGVSAVRDLDEARRKLDGLDLGPARRQRWLEVLRALHNADLRAGLDADSLAHLPGFRAFVSRVGGDAPERDRTATREVLRTLHEMTQAGLLEHGIYFTAWVRYGIRNPSSACFGVVAEAERAIAKVLREAHPEAEPGGEVPLGIEALVERLRGEEVTITRDAALTLLRGWTREGVDGRPVLRLRGGGTRLRTALMVDWPALEAELELRREVAQTAVGVLVERVRRLDRTGEVLVRFSLDDLKRGVEGALGLGQRLRDEFDALEKALVFLDENGVVKLEKGLAVFRQAMKIRVLEEARGRRYGAADYRPLEDHYAGRVLQIHAMGRYVEEAGKAAEDGRGYVQDYFTIRSAAFRSRYFGDAGEAVARATSRELYASIVEALRNPAQEAIVTASTAGNMLVLAGPGSGKTRVVVHRCAYLVKVARVRPERILVVCFNRGAMHELRRRIRDLAGDAARRVAIHTYHSLALALTERSMAARAAAAKEDIDFGAIIDDANRRLRGEEEVVGADAEDLRDRLLAGFEHVLVDEYQDIDADQYELLTHVARRRGQDGDERASILAVGDDDQTIYEWRSANVEFLRRFEDEYDAARHYLTENYRSTRNIVEAANALIARNRDRMKTDTPIRVDARRAHDPPGGEWEALDAVGRGRVVVLDIRDAADQAASVLAEIERLRGLDANPDWHDFAVLAWTHGELAQTRAALEDAGVPCRWALPRKSLPPLARLREFSRLLASLSGKEDADVRLADLRGRLRDVCGSSSMWTAMADRMLGGIGAELGEEACAVDVAESLHRALADHHHAHVVGDGVLLGTVHAAKGREFAHVLVLGGGWGGHPNGAHMESVGGRGEEGRRLYYVAMTRAEETLTLVNRADDPLPYLREIGAGRVHRRRIAVSKRFGSTADVRYETLGKRELYIDFAAGEPANAAVHKALARAEAGDRVTLRRNERGHVDVYDRGGTRIARLSQSAARNLDRESLGDGAEVRVLGLIQRESGDVIEDAYRSRVRVRSWEYPMLEVRLSGSLS